MDECASQVTLFKQALLLELAGERRCAMLPALAINMEGVPFLLEN